MSDVPAYSKYTVNKNIQWGYKSTPQKTSCLGMNNNQCIYPSGKVLGGSSTINGMYYVRGNPDDYDNWGRLGNEGWNSKEVLTYFKKSEKLLLKSADEEYHSRNGLLGVSYSWEQKSYNTFHNIMYQSVEEAGYRRTLDINGKNQVGFTQSQRTLSNNRRENTGKVFLGGGDITNLYVSKFSEVQSLIVEDGRTVGVNLIRQGKYIKIRAKNEVILSAGSLNTPKILMQSGYGPKEHLTEAGVNVLKDIPGIGNNLQDHFIYFGSAFTLNQVFDCETMGDFEKENQQFWSHPENPGTLASRTSSDFMGFIDTVKNSEIPDIQFISFGFCGKDPKHVRWFLSEENLREDLINDIITATPNRDYFFFLPVLLRAESRGSVRLNTSNPNGPPLIDSQMFTHPEDVETLTRGIRAAIRIMESSPLKHLQPKLVDFNIPGCSGLDPESQIKCQVRYLSISLYHSVGTCKMGPRTDPMAVVDSRLRFYDVEGLRVIDASVFPVIPRGNTNAPTIMLAERGADWIKQDHIVSE